LSSPDGFEDLVVEVGGELAIAKRECGVHQVEGIEFRIEVAAVWG
jgi:hypothetical protein